jgi:hypothetical protein
MRLVSDSIAKQTVTIGGNNFYVFLIAAAFIVWFWLQHRSACNEAIRKRKLKKKMKRQPLRNRPRFQKTQSDGTPKIDEEPNGDANRANGRKRSESTNNRNRREQRTATRHRTGTGEAGKTFVERNDGH